MNLIRGIQTADGVRAIQPSDGTVIMPSKSTIFNTDGSIVETTDFWELKTTFETDGSIIEKYTFTDGSWRQKMTTFASDGSITETVTEGP